MDFFRADCDCSPAFASNRARACAALSRMGLSLDSAHFPGRGGRFDYQLVDGPAGALVAWASRDHGRGSILLPVAEDASGDRLAWKFVANPSLRSKSPP